MRAYPRLGFVFARQCHLRSALEGDEHARANPPFTMSNPSAGDAPCGQEFLSLSIANPQRGSRWWSQTGSNRRPHACKARALPTELWPLFRDEPARAVVKSRRGASRRLVGPGRLELPTLRLSGVRSNHLSYEPMTAAQSGRYAPLGSRSHPPASNLMDQAGRGCCGKRNEDGGVPHLIRCL